MDLLQEITYFSFDSLDPTMQESVAQAVAEFTSNEGYEKYKMMKQTPQQIKAKLGIVAMDSSVEPPRLVGYIGASEPTLHMGQLMSEMGTLFVKSDYQMQGASKKLWELLVVKLQLEGVMPYAFCNENSLAGALSVGFQEIASSAQVPSDALDLCAGCSQFACVQKSEKLCCDTIVVHAGGQQNAQ